MIAVVGGSSRIATEFAHIVGQTRGLRLGALAPDLHRYLICVGLLVGKRLTGMSDSDILRTFKTNFHDIAYFLDHLFTLDDHARVCVIGSESGYSGSYDMDYAAAKAALHLYVETKQIGPNQQLVAIAPGIIGDSGMTIRRPDQERVQERAEKHPKRRHCTAREVASLAAWLLGDDGEYVSGTVVRMNGGERR